MEKNNKAELLFLNILPRKIKFTHLIFSWGLCILFIAASDEPLAFLIHNNKIFSELHTQGTLHNCRKSRRVSWIAVQTKGGLITLNYGSSYLIDPLGENIRKHIGSEVSIYHIRVNGLINNGRTYIYSIAKENKNIFNYEKKGMLIDLQSRLENQKIIFIPTVMLLICSVFLSVSYFLSTKTEGEVNE